ncbi:hypothetical protein [Frederiksenia canicola]|uniref:Uncharacterized protein n=1 Tax=Frederiksenia canicola TaxID=123824 RepID=A0AAE6X501_9PAST|nr:hypothetical protein [Frederiksenia canicola]QIM64302.1 hypothetical protein A4G17_01945 [Frederiksenia canicola]RPE93847.1 hypothetical protein EDC49_1362 [Frederiksenia canicola]
MMANRLLTVTRALISNVHLGISEKEAYFEVHFLNARNEVSRLENLLSIKLKRIKEESPAGRLYTRYTVADAAQVRKIANFHNGKLQANKHRKDYADIEPITKEQIERAIELLGQK